MLIDVSWVGVTLIDLSCWVAVSLCPDIWSPIPGMTPRILRRKLHPGFSRQAWKISNKTVRAEAGMFEEGELLETVTLYIHLEGQGHKLLLIMSTLSY